jgi:pimeloyl-ACP methyl ester carboxylesterase
VAAVVAVGLVLAAGCGSSSTQAEGGEDRPDTAGLVDLGNGRSIHMECRGSGGPTVVLVTGLGERADNFMITSADPTSDEWSVFPAVAGFTRVCAYDRPGTTILTDDGFELSRSTPVEVPATVGDSAEDLDLLLRASGEEGPYVLAGHSLGGPIVRLYAAAHPDDVAGIVFIDALSENLGDGLTAAQVESFEQLNSSASQGRPPGSEETFYSTAVVPLLRDVPAAPDVPTIILTADQWPLTAEVVEAGRAAGTLPEFVTVELADALWASQLVAQDVLAAKFPGAQHITETDATHYIHLDNPQLVIDSIRDVVDQVRAATPS